MKNQQIYPNQRENGCESRSSISLFAGLFLIVSVISGLFFLSSCNEPCEDCPPENIVISPEMIQSEIQEKLINVEDNKVIEVKPGTYTFTSTISLEGKSNITIKGSGSAVTIWNFENQTDGAEGMLVTSCNNFQISDLTIQEAKGDGIKVKDSDGVRFINIAAVWNTDKSTENGTYGIYPVLCKNILIDGCYAKGSSDAGIYVGQSTNAIVRNSKAEKNVVGIEIENTVNADVHNNEVTNNTGGILILDLQNLTQIGKTTRVFDNQITNNNFDNFAETGTIAAITPAGTGILILASREVEIFENEIKNNNLIGIGIVSYIAISVLTGEAITDPNFDPYSDKIYIHKNTVQKDNQVNTTGQSDLGLLVLSKFGGNPVPDFVTDGIFKTGTGDSGGICFNNNTGGSFVNLDVIYGFVNPSFDHTPHECEGMILSPVNIGE